MPTKLMGILNVTPDSFVEESRYSTVDLAIERGKQIIREGADIVDIGGESTRPNATPIDEATELARVIPVIDALRSVSAIPISIDTLKPRVAKAAIDAGATMINDVAGFRDPAMQELAAALQVDVCVMHMQGTPQTMQLNPQYPEGIIDHLLHWFDKQARLLIHRGVPQERIILDPGIGFGKTVADNVQIIQNLGRLKELGFPLLVGVSRKSFMSKILKKPAAELLPATIAVNTCLLLSNNVDIIRVHDVSEHRGVIDLLRSMR